MTRRRSPLFAMVASMLLVLAACGGAIVRTELTDPTAIVTAALQSRETAKSVHVDAAVDGTAPIAIPGLGGDGRPDRPQRDLRVRRPRHGEHRGPCDLQRAGAASTWPASSSRSTARRYLKTTLGGAQYEVIDLANQAVDPADTSGMIDNLGDFLLERRRHPDQGRGRRVRIGDHATRSRRASPPTS